MNKNHLIKLFFALFVFSFVGCDKDFIQNENGDIINNGNGTQTPNETPNDGDNTTVETPNTGNGNNAVIDHLNLLNGTVWYADSGTLFIEFHGNLIALRNYQYFGSMGGNLNGNVTLGAFRISSYDGETMKVLDYDELEVAFTVIVSENKMTVSRLDAIKWAAPPIQRRDFRSFNQKYTKGE